MPAHARYASPGTFRCRGRCIIGVVLSGCRSDGGGPVRVDRRRRAQHPGRCSRSPTCSACDGRLRSRAATTGSRCAPKRAAHGHRRRFQHDPGRGDDRGGRGAVRRGPTTLRNIGSWRVKETDRIDGDGDASSPSWARKSSRGPDWLRVSLRREASRRRRSTPTTTIAWRCAFRWPRWAAWRCASTIRNACARRFPDYFAEFGKLAS